jgi:hypothetical protein
MLVHLLGLRQHALHALQVLLHVLVLPAMHRLLEALQVA